MIQIPESVFSRSYSAAWITPAGDFIPLERDEDHTSLAANFPGMPTDDQLAIDYPSTYAIARMRYVKVSSPLQCAWDGKGRRGDVRMQAMADFMSQAMVWLRGSRHNPWEINPHSDLTRVKVYVTSVISPDVYARAERDELTVGDFIDSYGSRETINYFYGKLMGESFVRTCRMIERRLLGPKGLNESRKLADNDRLYRMIVSELRKAG